MNLNDITPIYEYTFAEARKNGERDVSLYRASHKANIDCARAIDKAVSDNFDGMRLNRNAADSVIADYGIDRVMVILAHTLNEKNYDGRFSRTNKEWAKTVRLPNCITMDNAGDQYYLNAHPAVLDGFVDIVRERYKALNLWSGEHCNYACNLDFTDRVMVLKPEILKDEYKCPDNQLFYCSGGFGCSPTAFGQKVFGHYLADGETTHYRRSDFIGELKPDYLPDWAKEKIADMKKPSIKAQLADAAKNVPTGKRNKVKKDEIDL